MAMELSATRPATVFLCYRREDEEEVKYLQQQLEVRGMRTLRDVTDLHLGADVDKEITDMIEKRCDAFVIYITPGCLEADYVWEIEVPTAQGRRKNDLAFQIIPILRGVEDAEVQHLCANRAIDPVMKFHGKILRLSNHLTDETKEEHNRQLREFAQQVLQATVNKQFRRVGADCSYEPYLCLRTFKAYKPPTNHLDLDLDWQELFLPEGHLPSGEEWQDTLFPALKEIKEVLRGSNEYSISPRLHLFVKALLPVAFAFGFVFREITGTTLLLEDPNGKDPQDIWSTDATPSDPSPLEKSVHKIGNEHTDTAAVEIGITTPIEVVAKGVASYIQAQNLSWDYRLQFKMPGGSIGDDVVKDSAHALAIARQIRKELKILGCSRIHLFAAIPARLAVLIGYHLNAIGKITLYWHSTDSGYKPACTLM